jgi:hypothetical protein
VNDGDGNAKQYIFFWDGKTLQKVQVLESWAGATGYVERFFIYPTEKNGKAGKITQRIVTKLTTGESEDDEAIYIWKNGKLEKISKFSGKIEQSASILHIISFEAFL